MSNPANTDELKNRHYTSLILRLTLDQWGRLIQGELVDMTNTPRQRFTTLSELNKAVAVWLKQQEKTDSKQGKNTLISTSKNTKLSAKN